jgi:hypothetical protein
LTQVHGGIGVDRAAAARLLTKEWSIDGRSDVLNRRGPAREVLRQFYYRYIDGMPPGVPIAEWTDLLYARKPNERAFAITSPDGARLFLELDRRGNLIGYKSGD